jgi:dihydrofolate reductase
VRKVIAAVQLSLDGVTQAPGTPEEDPSGGFSQGGWSFNYWDQELGAMFEELGPSSFDLLLGRTTYHIIAAHWQYQDDPISKNFNAVKKFLSR